MYNYGKYIVGEINGVLTSVCFSEVVSHDSFRGVFDQDSIIGAGFFNVVEDIDLPTGLSASCYGKSVGLGIESNSTLDNKLTSRALGLNPI